jgi:lipopolysaccharide transport system permease protein
MQIKTYTPRRKESLYQLLKDTINGFLEGRELGYRLFIRDTKASYQKSLLGILWLFLPALATAGIWIFLNNQNVVAITDVPMDYAAFTMCGTLLWSLFAEAIVKPMQRYQSAMGMMSKLNFPREALLLTSMYDMLFSFLLKLIILIPILWLLGYPPDWNFLFALLWTFVLIVLGLSIGIVLSPIGLLYTDIGKGINLVLPFLMYLTPVIYPLRQSGLLAELQFLNPVTPFLERARSYMGGYEFVMTTNLWLWVLLTLVILLIGLLSIRIAMPIIVERSGS